MWLLGRGTQEVADAPSDCEVEGYKPWGSEVEGYKPSDCEVEGYAVQYDPVDVVALSCTWY